MYTVCTVDAGARKHVSIVGGEESTSSTRRKRETLKRQDTPIHPDIVSISNATPASALIRRPTVLKSLSANAHTGGEPVSSPNQT